ncbi:MAG: alkaline phosphatase [Deltaproteobacteria bacterium]|jgi:alkaline phosphatase|nr:alkaline phosphatase [Deltaproteobacteria bacterium]
MRVKAVHLFVALLLCTLSPGGVFAAPSLAVDAKDAPRYVFVFIGDGASFPQRSAAESYKASRAAKPDLGPAVLRAQKKISRNTGITDFTPAADRLLMNTFPAQGVSTTYSYNALITDSSSSGTAIATGKKTRDGVVGMDPEGKEKYVSMAKMAKARGRSVGIITSVSIDHATPASFYACQPSRNQFYEIARQIPETRFDYFAGGGFRQPTGAKKDQKDLYAIFAESGYSITQDKAGFAALGKGKGKIIAISPVLDASHAMPYDIDKGKDEITLAEFVAKGIELLDGPKGFFMMVEGGKIDWACHANDAKTAILDVLAFDDAVAVAYAFYTKRPKDTLIVVTGDHETGGMTMGFAGTRYDTFMDIISKQKGSYLAFDKIIAQLRKEKPEATLEDVMPDITDFFGLRLYSVEVLAEMKKKASEGDEEAVAALQFALQPYEVENLRKALAMTLEPKDKRPRSEDTYYLAYGGYEPLSVTLTHILNNKAGIGWTTYAHSGLPTPVSAIGVGHEKFAGHYDNTDIFQKVISIARY